MVSGMNRILFLCCLVAVALARKSLRDPVTRNLELRSDFLEGLVSQDADCDAATVIDNVTYPWNTYWFNVKLDHFTYSDTRTFNMKYLVNNCYYKAGGPIFFYTGNEGGIEGFATATGIMWDLAPLFNAAIVLAEHRFYGETLPFGPNSYDSIEHMGYLTAEQALADYADFLIQLKTADNNNVTAVTYPSNTPVVAFGGSYGGMLAAWFRMKYPHLVVGSWAASAPLKYVLGGGIDPGVFDHITTRTYEASKCNPYILFNCWNAIRNLSSTDDGRNFLNTNMNLNENTTIQNENDGENLISYIREGIEYMAMVDYPYPSDFLTNMPGDPVTVACLSMNAPGNNFTDQQLAMMVYNASQVYYNWNTTNPQPYCIDPSQCGDPATASLGSDLGWPWQECSEIVMDMCATGPPNDMFWNECSNDTIATLASGCQQIFADYNWTTANWNVRAVETRFGLNLLGHSNIILTQGHLDPWSGGGYAPTDPGVTTANGIYVVDIPGSAHHLDLRLPNNCDPNTVTNMRYQIVDILRAFIAGNGVLPDLKPLPALQTRTIPDEQCKDVNAGYPWGQGGNAQNPTDAPTQPPTTTSASSLFTLFSFASVVTRLL